MREHLAEMARVNSAARGQGARHMLFGMVVGGAVVWGIMTHHLEQTLRVMAMNQVAAKSEDVATTPPSSNWVIEASLSPDREGDTPRVEAVINQGGQLRIELMGETESLSRALSKEDGELTQAVALQLEDEDGFVVYALKSPLSEWVYLEDEGLLRFERTVPKLMVSVIRKITVIVGGGEFPGLEKVENDLGDTEASTASVEPVPVESGNNDDIKNARKAGNFGLGDQSLTLSNNDNNN